MVKTNCYSSKTRHAGSVINSCCGVKDGGLGPCGYLSVLHGIWAGREPVLHGIWAGRAGTLGGGAGRAGSHPSTLSCTVCC